MPQTCGNGVFHMTKAEALSCVHVWPDCGVVAWNWERIIKLVGSDLPIQMTTTPERWYIMASLMSDNED